MLRNLNVQIFSFADVPLEFVFHEKESTFLENARGKAVAYSRDWDGLTLAEDSGLEVAGLDNAPGVYSARFAGPDASDDANIDQVLILLKNKPRTQRKARFVSCMVLARQKTIIKEITGDVHGVITEKRLGSSGFGYDPIFFYPPLGKTFGQLTAKEKNRVSHRGKAMKLLRVFLADYLEKDRR